MMLGGMSSPDPSARIRVFAVAVSVAAVALAVAAVVALLGGPDPLGRPIRTLGFSGLLFAVFAVQLRDPQLTAGRRRFLFAGTERPAGCFWRSTRSSSSPASCSPASALHRRLAPLPPTVKARLRAAQPC